MTENVVGSIILGPDGTKASADAVNLYLPEGVTAVPPKKKRNWRPAPGRVLVFRPDIDRWYRDEAGNPTVEKSEITIADEERNNTEAVIVRVGDALDRQPWFEEGDRVTVAPHGLTEVDLGGITGWHGGYMAVTGVFEGENENEESE